MKKGKMILGLLFTVILSVSMTGCTAIATTKITPVPAEIETIDSIIVAMGEDSQIETIVKSDVDLGMVEMPETKTVAGMTMDAIYDIQEFDYTVSYISADEHIVVVDENGVISPISVGKTTVTISAGEISKDIDVAVKEYYIPKEMPVAVDVLINKSFNIFEELNENQIVKAIFTVEDENIATVDSNGTITALKQGVTRLVTNAESLEFQTAISVRVPLEDITVFDKTVDAGKTVKAKVGIIPEEADYGTVLTYSSSDENVASVDAKGNITGKKAGTATITVKTESGIEKTFKVTIKAAAAPVVSVPSTSGGGVLGSGADTSSNKNSYYPEGSILYGYTKEEIIAMYPEPAYGATSFENENAKAPWYWQFVTITYSWDSNTNNYMQDLVFAGGSNQNEIMKYAESVFPWPSSNEGTKSATVWVYLGDGLV